MRKKKKEEGEGWGVFGAGLHFLPSASVWRDLSSCMHTYIPTECQIFFVLST